MGRGNNRIPKILRADQMPPGSLPPGMTAPPPVIPVSLEVKGDTLAQRLTSMHKSLVQAATDAKFNGGVIQFDGGVVISLFGFLAQVATEVDELRKEFEEAKKSDGLPTTTDG